MNIFPTNSVACTYCFKVNIVSGNSAAILEIASPPVLLSRFGNSLFSTEPRDSMDSFDIEIPICSVCMESSGDCIFLNCGHGGFCESCASQLVVKFGDCSSCRTPITSLYRLVEISRSTATAVVLEVPTLKGGDTPRVPYPKKLKSS